LRPGMRELFPGPRLTSHVRYQPLCRTL